MGSSPSPWQDFLATARQLPASPSICIGNQAGDADSIVSAIALAYVDTIDGTPKTPILSISEQDLKTQRPETMLLLELANVPVESLLYLDSFPLNEEVALTLVDHNRNQLPNCKVVEIYDHHLDEGDHQDTCKIREIAFEGNRALVASTCTLVTERLLQVHAKPFPHAVGMMLLGVILLDSVNLSPTAGKGTERDAAAIQALLQHTDWKSGQPDPSTLFEKLQQAKFDPRFWNGLRVRDALRLDYKEFPAGHNRRLGISTVLQNHGDFVRKPRLEYDVDAYIQEMGVDPFVVLFTSTDEKGELSRELLLVGRENDPSLIQYLMQNPSLQLTETPIPSSPSNYGLWVAYAQGNASASRKQVAPIFIRYYEEKRPARTL